MENSRSLYGQKMALVCFYAKFMQTDNYLRQFKNCCNHFDKPNVLKMGVCCILYVQIKNKQVRDEYNVRIRTVIKQIRNVGNLSLCKVSELSEKISGKVRSLLNPNHGTQLRKIVDAVISEDQYSDLKSFSWNHELVKLNSSKVN